jgi:hypothetical protein
MCWRFRRDEYNIESSYCREIFAGWTMALVDIKHPTAIHDQRLLDLFQFWHGKLNGRRLPRPEDVDPTDVARWADNLMMVDVPGTIADFRIRWLGPAIAAMFSIPRAGTGIEAMSEAERNSILPQYRVVIDTGLPAYYETEVELNKRGVVAQRKLILPLSSGGGKVDAVLAGIYPDPPRKGRPQRPRTSKSPLG